MQLGLLAMVGFDSEAGLRALADPRRRRMLALVWDRERSSSDLARRCELSRPAASQHLRVLREADLVSVRYDGNRRLYRVRADRLAELRAMLDAFWGDRLAGLQAELSGSELSGSGPDGYGLSGSGLTGSGLTGSGLDGPGVSEREGNG